MAATLRSSPLSTSQRLYTNHNHRQRSPSPCNRRLKFFSPGNIPKKPKCLCSPTTHPGSFRCAFHRRLEHEKTKSVSSFTAKRCDTMTIKVGLNLRKLALINSLAKIDISVESNRFLKSLAASLVNPSSRYIGVRREFRPRLSRFYELRKDQD